MRGGGLHASSCEDVDAGLGLTGIGRMPSSEPEGPSNSGPACAPLRPRLIRCSASSVALPLLHSLCAQHTSRPHASSWNKNPYRSILTTQVIFETGIQLLVQVKNLRNISASADWFRSLEVGSFVQFFNLFTLDWSIVVSMIFRASFLSRKNIGEYKFCFEYSLLRKEKKNLCWKIACKNVKRYFQTIIVCKNLLEIGTDGFFPFLIK